MRRFIRSHHSLFDLQKQLHAESIKNPEAFWSKVASEIHWNKPFSSVYDPKTDIWFPNGELNMSYNCLDRHCLAGHGHNLALIHDSAAQGTITRLSYSDLLHSVQVLAGVLRSYGIKKGSTVLIYMPAIKEAVIRYSMLSI
jgi:propionyl-CoA synthetase